MAQLPNDPEFQKLFKVVTDKNPSLSHQQRYYRTQRLIDEKREKVGNAAATREAGTIHQKTGRKLTGAEGDLLLKPGASEGQQMLNTALAADYPIGRVLGAVRGAVPLAAEAGNVARGIAQKAIGRAGPRVVGKATVEDVGKSGSRAALKRTSSGPGGNLAARKALKPGEPRAIKRTLEAPKSARKSPPDLENTAKGTPRKVNPRAAGTHPRAMGTNPRAVAARRAAKAVRTESLRKADNTGSSGDKKMAKTLGEKISARVKKNVASNVSDLPREAQHELGGLGRDISRQGTRGKAGTFEMSGSDRPGYKGSTSPGRPYNMRDVADARRLLKQHGVQASPQQAENLLSEVMHRELWK